MVIGTAKPSVAERRSVPHHLIDIVDPTGSYSAAQFRSDAVRLISEIAARGRIPLLVGGTMLYFKALREGLSELPESDAAVRARIDAEAAERGWPALHAELAKIDAPTAAVIDRRGGTSKESLGAMSCVIAGSLRRVSSPSASSRGCGR